MATPAPEMDLSKIPLGPNPTGGPSNFDNPPTLMKPHNGVGITLIVLGIIFVSLRVATNARVARKLCLDDYLCIFAQLGGIGYWITTHIVADRVTARHVWVISVAAVTTYEIKIEAATQLTTAPTMWAAKSSILALYIRLFGVFTWLRRTSYALIAFMALFYGGIIVVFGVYCIPRAGETWDGASIQRCGKSYWSIIVFGVFGSVSDLIILILPFPILLKLRQSRKRVVAVFSSGLILIALSVVSLYYRVEIFKSVDPTWNGTVLQIVTFAEIFGTIVVSCAPALFAFWSKVLTKSTLWSRFESGSIFSLFSRKSGSVKSGSVKEEDVTAMRNNSSDSAGIPLQDHEPRT